MTTGPESVVSRIAERRLVEKWASGPREVKSKRFSVPANWPGKNNGISRLREAPPHSEDVWQNSKDSWKGIKDSLSGKRRFVRTNTGCITRVAAQGAVGNLN